MCGDQNSLWSLIIALSITFTREVETWQCQTPIKRLETTPFSNCLLLLSTIIIRLHNTMATTQPRTTSLHRYLLSSKTIIQSINNQQPSQNVPSNNNSNMMILTKRDMERNLFERNEINHWSKIIRVRSTIDNEFSTALIKKHVRNKKPLQLDEERNTEIERANRILLEKITRILKNKQMGPQDAAANFKDNRSRSQVGVYHNSSSSVKRERDKRRISNENQRIVDRLMNQRSQYEISQLKRDEAKHQKFLNNLSHFPRALSIREGMQMKRDSPSPKILIVKQQGSDESFELCKVARNKRDSLSPIKGNESRVGIMNNQEIIEKQRAFSKQSKTSRQTLQINSLENQNPYASLEKSDYENLSQNKIGHDDSFQKQNIFIRNRSVKRQQPFQTSNTHAANNSGLMIHTSVLHPSHEELNPPVPQKAQILINENLFSHYTNSHELLFPVVKELSPRKEDNTFIAIREHITKNASTRYQSRIRHKKGRNFTPLKVWGLESQSTLHNSNSSLNICGKGDVETREVLYQRVRKVEGKPMMIEVSQTKNKVFITCIEQETQRQHVIQMFKKQADFLIEQTELRNLQSKKLNGFAKLVKLLEFRFNRLVLNENKEVQPPSVANVIY